jgi:hypothetical protein
MKKEILRDEEKLKVLARVVSHLMGDGCVSKRYFAYYNKNQVLLENFKRDVKKIFGEIHFITGKVNSGTSFYMIQNKEALSFLKSLIEDYRSFSLHIPEFIKTKELKKEFLKAIFDDEGCVALRVFAKTGEIKRNITLCAKSEFFLSQIKDILERDFMIKCNKLTKYIKKVNNKEFLYWVLSITGKDNFVKFKENINFYHPDKKNKLDLMISSYVRK